MNHTLIRLWLSGFIMTTCSLIYAQQKTDTTVTEGIIHVSIEVVTTRGAQPFGTPAEFRFAGSMMIESRKSIEVTEASGIQTHSEKRNGYYILDTKNSRYYKTDTLACNIKPLKSGNLSDKPDGILFNEQLDLFKNRSDVQVLRDSVCDGVSYKRFQVITVDPSSKKEVHVTAYAVAQINRLPFSLSGTLEKKYHCTVSFLNVYYPEVKGMLRKTMRYVPYRLSEAEKKTLRCFSN